MSNRRKTRGRPVPPHAQLKPGVYILNIQHDDGCPTIRTQRVTDCTCSEVMERVVDAKTYVKQMQKGGAQ
jgi:hypothetical protein